LLTPQQKLLTAQHSVLPVQNCIIRTGEKGHFHQEGTFSSRRDTFIKNLHCDRESSLSEVIGRKAIP